jgi:rubrerythrin
METDPTLLEIIDLCYEFDKTARQFYLDLSYGTKDKELKGFWRHMSSEEGVHCHYWEELMKKAKKDFIPLPFDQAEDIKKELKMLVSKNSSLLSEHRDVQDTEKNFILAYRMEFCFLHPGFLALLPFLKDLTNGKTPEEDYEFHLDTFINQFIKHTKNSLELELAGDILKRLFTDNRNLAHKMGEVKRLSGLLPICANCKKIRDEQGAWHQLESYISEHTEADFTHGVCPECTEILYPELSARGSQMDNKPFVSTLSSNMVKKGERGNWRRVVRGNIREKRGPSASEVRDKGLFVIEMRSGKERRSGKDRRSGIQNR